METKVTYYPISESAARRAKNANSFSDYVEGSATADYRRMVDAAVEIAERQKNRVDPEYHARIDSLLDAYARKLADNINQANSIDASVPSVMIAGPANFPIHKKEKQNARRDANMREYESIKGILDTIRSVGTGGITSDDPRALEKLYKKLAELEALQEKMKTVNAYYRKNKTLEGCPQLEAVSVERLTASMETFDRQPYPAWALSNNNANIHRVRERIAVLEKEVERAAKGPAEIAGEGYTVRENSNIGRIQIVFDGKPSAEIRELLKANGFRWAPSEGAWQRLLNDHGRSAAEYVTNKIKDMEVF